MANFKSQKEIVQKIDANIELLESGKLSLEELELHVDLVRELYERTIVLRYKAFELSVGKPAIETTKEEPIKEEEIILPEVEAAVEIEDELPEIEFSLFEDEDEVSAMEVEIEAVVEEEIIPAPIIEKAPEPIILEEKSEPTVNSEIHETILQENAGEFLSKFQSIENELTKQFGVSKLETLVGSFGLNERLQYINELFDGSSEIFSDAIKSLDTLPNINSAKSKTADLAIQNNWDVESDTVEEFIQKICRRYA